MPAIAAVGDYETFTPATFKLPEGYIKRAPPRDADLIDNPRVVEYDLDADDVVRASSEPARGRSRVRPAAGGGGCALRAGGGGCALRVWRLSALRRVPCASPLCCEA